MKSYNRLNLEERAKIEVLYQKGFNCTEIAFELGRHKSTISRELSRFPQSYLAGKAQINARKFSKRHNFVSRLEKNPPLLREVLGRLKKYCSPEQISTYLKQKYVQDKKMQLSHESIYTYIYLLPRGKLKDEIIRYLRQKKKFRYKRKTKEDRRGKLPDMISIEERPAEVADRSVAGHWEGDLLMGKLRQSAIGTIVERKTRTVILVKIKSKDAPTVRKAFEKELRNLPRQMKKSMTYDQGNEMAEHKLFTKNTKMKVYFCHPASPWERGTNENTNMLLRDYFPRGTDLSKISRKQLKKVQYELNGRIRKGLNWKSPLELFEQEILNKCR
jgi:IS30 family transposase